MYFLREPRVSWLCLCLVCVPRVLWALQRECMTRIWGRCLCVTRAWALCRAVPATTLQFPGRPLSRYIKSEKTHPWERRQREATFTHGKSQREVLVGGCMLVSGGSFWGGCKREGVGHQDGGAVLSVPGTPPGDTSRRMKTKMIMEPRPWLSTSVSSLGDVYRSGQWNQDLGNSNQRKGDLVQPTGTGGRSGEEPTRQLPHRRV